GMRKLLTFLLMICFISLTPALVQAKNPAETHVYDEANLLSDLHIEELESLAKKYGEKWEIDFIFFTRKDPTTDIGDYMDDCYDEKGPGYEKPSGTAVLTGIDMAGRDIVIDSYGEAKDKLDPDRLVAINDAITVDLSRGNYVEAFSDVIYLSDEYLPYRPGVDPNNPF